MNVRAPSRREWNLFPENRLDVLLSITCVRLKDQTREKIFATLKAFEPHSDEKISFPTNYQLGQAIDFEAGISTKIQEAEMKNFPINCWISPEGQTGNSNSNSNRVYFLTNG